MYFIIIFAALYLTGTLLYGTRGNMNTGNKSKIFSASLLLSVALSVFLFFSQAWFGVCSPGSWFERSDYETEVYVNLFPEGSTSKNYRVSALIKANLDRHDEGVQRVYRLQHISFPAGRRITFDNTPSLQLGSRVTVYDDEYHPWSVELTSERPSNRQ